jgi:uncharacterized membrane protein
MTHVAIVGGAHLTARPRQPITGARRKRLTKRTHKPAHASAKHGRAALHGVLTALALALAACGSDEPEPSDLTCPEGNTLSYQNFGRQFVADYCVSCHAGALPVSARQGAPLDQVFDTSAQLRAKAGLLQREVTLEQRMPFGPSSPKPTDQARLAFGQWLACGAPD